MNQLELLWKLQIHEQRLSSIMENLDELEKGIMVDNLNLRIKRLERDIIKKKNSLKKNDERIRENNLKLKQFDYQLKEVEKSLYSGTITDLKQLDYMDKESKSLRKEINEMELEILSLMEEIEDLKELINEVECEHIKLKKDFEVFRVKQKTKKEELKKEVNSEIEIISEIKSKLEKSALEKYNIAKKNKGYAVAEVLDDECSGCHMIISTSLINKVKKEQDIFQCENCGRILYYKNCICNKE